jgi:hypothetical protein
MSTPVDTTPLPDSDAVAIVGAGEIAKVTSLIFYSSRAELHLLSVMARWLPDARTFFLHFTPYLPSSCRTPLSSMTISTHF